MEILYIQAYLTDAAAISKIYGCKNNVLLEKLFIKLKYALEDLDDQFDDAISEKENAKAVLIDMVHGNQTYTKILPMYLCMYQELCDSFGEQIFSPNDEYNTDLFEALALPQSYFMPLPTTLAEPVIASIENKNLADLKAKILAQKDLEDFNDKELKEHKSDFVYLIDKAIAAKKDIVFCMS
jgi:hypothetical protein